jgi:hypothetical protein
MVSKSFPRRKEGCIYKGSKENIMNIIGIDVSKSKLDYALIDNSTHRKLKFKVVSNFEEGFVTLIDWLAKCTKSSISMNLDQAFAGEVEYQKLAAPLLEPNSIWLRFQFYNITLILKYKISGY